MTDPPSCDNDLLRRLNALKKSHITLDTASDTPLPIPKAQSTPESSLANRLKYLRNGATPTAGDDCSRVSVRRDDVNRGTPLTFHASDLDVESANEDLQSLLRELQPTQDRKPEAINKEMMRSLMAEARNALILAREKEPLKPITGPSEISSPSRGTNPPLKKQPARSFDGDLDHEDEDGTQDVENTSDEDEDEKSREAAQVISQLLDEIDLDRIQATAAPEDADAGETKQPAIPSPPSTFHPNRHTFPSPSPSPFPSPPLDPASPSLSPSPAPAPHHEKHPTPSLTPQANDKGLNALDDLPGPEPNLPSAKPQRNPAECPGAAEEDAMNASFVSSIEARMAALRNRGVVSGVASTEATSASNPNISLPSVPSSLPSTLSSLSLPAAPRTAPGGKSFKGNTARERETWCGICFDDATVLCFGCGEEGVGEGTGGLLYCARCWREGHLGGEVDGETRGHRWVRWRG